jgi:hypothetical protein
MTDEDIGYQKFNLILNDTGGNENTYKMGVEILRIELIVEIVPEVIEEVVVVVEEPVVDKFPNLYAKLGNISNFGDIYIQFTEQIDTSPFENISMLYDTILKFDILPTDSDEDDNYDPSSYAYTWDVIKITSTSI